MKMRALGEGNRKTGLALLAVLAAAGLAAGCGRAEASQGSGTAAGYEAASRESGAAAGHEVSRESGAAAGHEAAQERGTSAEQASATNTVITPGPQIRRIADGFSAVDYDGDYWFDQFLEQGGASSDGKVIGFLTERLEMDGTGIGFGAEGFGCSTLAVKSPEGNALFGRNFDWENCEALVVRLGPSAEEGRYASISTVNLDFIRAGYDPGLSEVPEEIRTVMALYAPLDGMNDQGLAVSVNMIQDAAVIDQNTDKPDLTTTTAIRLLLDRAADVDEAVALLEQYDMHASMGMMVHFALADRSGRSAVAEYVDNRLVMTETPVVTNFYLAPGEKQGIGTAQSHTRYEILTERLAERETMTEDQVRAALDSVSKDNFGEFESTEWSIVFNLNSGEARYYHRENYGTGYTINVKD